MVNGHLPASKDEALALLARGAGPVVAGGTDLLVKRRRWPGVAPAIPASAVYVANLSELHGVRTAGDFVAIGAATPLAALAAHPLVPDLLKAAIRETASPGIRTQATLAGNLANASPAADPALVLVCLDALIRLESAAGVREVPANGFATGPGKTVLRPDELITAILVPSDAGLRTAFVKVGGRKADAIAKVSFAGAVRVVDGTIASFRAAFGAVGPTAVRIPALEERIAGLSVEDLKARLPEFLAACGAAIRPIDDQRSTAHYRRTVALHLLADFIGRL